MMKGGYLKRGMGKGGRRRIPLWCLIALRTILINSNHINNNSSNRHKHKHKHKITMVPERMAIQQAITVATTTITVVKLLIALALVQTRFQTPVIHPYNTNLALVLVPYVDR